MEDEEIIIIDDDDEYDDVRNATIVRSHRGQGRSGRSGSGSSSTPRSRGQTRIITRPRRDRRPARYNNGRGREGFTIGKIIRDGVPILAALQPLPAAPTATGKPDVDIKNVMIYQVALAQHAKRDEQLRTFAHVASHYID
jgi:hypothetical protein